ncbi:hypothetical protein K493DRAFT_312725 [Basidiobolus meristosporus CBS 931.73]|uniref:Uncharacterized protein n=1 Tax=Basidiobolus meristosporus CBS 931.73 TaxID=1314790 RepID=A0A1Y1YRN4_9FUNG|nr:hypothetical protein K493DRAFT_312725 [Basidiobolus meristosporus CBS 931.73]|eukprot:ORY00698.1 hypothetical protein K493DRAFT_312725 [Basidiobolus meristosporus CBS 931.73]
MAISGFLGAMLLITILGLLFASYARQYKGWRTVASLLILHAACQIIGMVFISDLYNTSSRFYYGTKYDISFIFCILSSILDVVLAVGITVTAITSPPAYYPL